MMSMLTLFESRYTLKGSTAYMYIDNVDKTASMTCMSMLTLFESRYTMYIKGTYSIHLLQGKYNIALCDGPLDFFKLDGNLVNLTLQFFFSYKIKQ